MEKLLHRGELLKLLICFSQDGLIGIIKPITLSFCKSFHGLCIELHIVDGDIGIDGGSHFNTDESATAAWVGQQILMVACADKRSVATHLLYSAS